MDVEVDYGTVGTLGVIPVDTGVTKTSTLIQNEVSCLI